jgi:hypothetical protein
MSRSGLHFDSERRPASFRVGRLDRVRQPRAQIAFDFQPVDDHLQRRAVAERGRVHVLERHRRVVYAEPAEPFPPQGSERLRDGIDEVRQVGLRTGLVGALFGRGGLLVVRFRRACHRLCRDDGHVEADQESRARRQLAEAARDDFRGFANDFASAPTAVGAPDAGIQQPQVIVNFGRRPHGRPRIANAVLLPDRDGGADSLDRIDVWLLHPLEELPRVGGERFDVAALPFRVDRVERERRLARSADPGHHDERPRRKRQVDVLEVVRPGAADDDLATTGLGCSRHLQVRFSEGA